jgi:hypothetical protein
VCGNGEHRTDHSRFDTTLTGLVATFVLSAASTPARIVGCGQYCRWLGRGVTHADKATGCLWHAK